MIAASDGNEMKQWFAPERDPQARAEMYRGFLAFVNSHSEHVLVSWSGTRFDERAVMEGLSRWWRKGLGVWETVPRLDLLTAIRKSLALPLHGWSLKDVAAWCGFTGYSDDLDGFEVGLKYEEYCRWRSPLPIDEIARYNADDVRALMFVADWIRDTAKDAEIEKVTVKRHYERIASPYRVVSFDSRRKSKSWRARLKLPGRKDVHIGYFSTSEEAARAYDAAARFHRGDLAMLNFPDESSALDTTGVFVNNDVLRG